MATTHHINLEQVARRMVLAQANGDTAAAQLVPPHQLMTQAQYLASVVEELRGMRRTLTDAEFRRKFLKFIN